MGEFMFWLLIIILYMVGGALFCVAYTVGFPQDKAPNLGFMVVFWVFIAIAHIGFQLVSGIGKTTSRVIRVFDSAKSPRRRSGRRVIDSKTRVYKDNGPGTD